MKYAIDNHRSFEAFKAQFNEYYIKIVEEALALDGIIVEEDIKEMMIEEAMRKGYADECMISNIGFIQKVS